MMSRALRSDMYCPECGWKVSVEGARFCMKCGVSLSDKIPGPVTPKSSPQVRPDPALSLQAPDAPDVQGGTSPEHPPRATPKGCEVCGQTIAPGNVRFPTPYQMRQAEDLAEHLAEANKLGAWQSTEAFIDEIKGRTSNWRSCASCLHYILGDRGWGDRGENLGYRCEL